MRLFRAIAGYQSTVVDLKGDGLRRVRRRSSAELIARRLHCADAEELLLLSC